MTKRSTKRRRTIRETGGRGRAFLARQEAKFMCQSVFRASLIYFRLKVGFFFCVGLLLFVVWFETGLSGFFSLTFVVLHISTGVGGMVCLIQLGTSGLWWLLCLLSEDTGSGLRMLLIK